MTRTASKWEARMIEEAKKWASYSKDPSTKVGAVIYDSIRNSIITTGYNGFPRGTSDSPKLYADRARKYPRIVHAEANAIVEAAYQGKSTRDMTLAITHPPCGDCAGIIIQSGIKTIYYEYTTDDMARLSGVEAMLLFEEANVYIMGLTL